MPLKRWHENFTSSIERFLDESKCSEINTTKTFLKTMKQSSSLSHVNTPKLNRNSNKHSGSHRVRRPTGLFALLVALGMSIYLSAGQPAPLRDDFDDGDIDGWTTWVPAGSIEVADGRILIIDSAAQAATIAVPIEPIEFADFEISADLNGWNPTATGSFYGLVGRANIRDDGSYNAYYAVLNPSSRGTPGTAILTLIHYSDFGSIVIAQQEGVAGNLFNSENHYHLVFTGIGTELKFSVFAGSDLENPIATVSGSDDQSAVGLPGMFVSDFDQLNGMPDGFSVYAFFDNFAAASPAPVVSFTADYSQTVLLRSPRGEQTQLTTARNTVQSSIGRYTSISQYGEDARIEVSSPGKVLQIITDGREVATFSNGDQIFILFDLTVDVTSGSPPFAFTGNAEIIGGTGRFEKLTGTFRYEGSSPDGMSSSFHGDGTTNLIMDEESQGGGNVSIKPAVILEWSNAGVLEGADQVQGPWLRFSDSGPNAEGVTQLAVPVNAAMKYFRLNSNIQ